jgi:hypothetical protein
MINRFWLAFCNRSTGTAAQGEEVRTNFWTAKSFDSGLHEAATYVQGLKDVQVVKNAFMNLLVQGILAPSSATPPTSSCGNRGSATWSR